MGKPPRQSYFHRRLDRRVSEIWALAADDPALALVRVRELREWLQAQQLTGQDELARQLFLSQLSELVRLLTS